MKRMPSVSALGLCGLLCAGVVSAGTITWTNKVTSSTSWGTAANWDTPPLFDGSEDAICGLFSVTDDITSVLDGNRWVNSLTIGGPQNFKVYPGTLATSRLILKSGSLTMTNKDYFAMQAAVQVDDGTNANPNAVWNTGPTGGGANNRETSGKIYGLEGTMITRTGTMPLFLQADSGGTYLGKWSLVQGTTRVDANNAMGRGKIFLGNNAILLADNHFGMSNDIECVSSANINVAIGKTLNLAGNLSGAAVLNVGNSGNKNGAMILRGTNNTHSGGVAFNYAAQLVVNGTWTNGGTVALYARYADCSLQGNGYLGLAAGKSVYSRPGDAAWRSFIAPGDGTPIFAPTNGSIGTLTIGTPGNTNVVDFSNSNAWFVVDVSTTASDTLVVNGQMNMATNNNAMLIFGTPAAARDYTLAQFTSRTGKFSRVFWNNNLVANADAPKAINGTHTLVYSDTSLKLVGQSSRGTVLHVR